MGAGPGIYKSYMLHRAFTHYTGTYLANVGICFLPLASLGLGLCELLGS